MKILHIGKFYYPSKGGIETVLKNLAEEQVRKGQQVTVLCFGNKGEEAVQDIEGVKVIRSGVFCTLFSQPLSFSLAFRIRNLVKSHDLIHVHLPNPLAEFILTCLLITKPIIVSYHSDVVRQKLIYIFYKPFQMLFLRKVSKIVTATQAQIRFSKTLSNFPSKCTVVPYGVTLKEYVLTEKISAQAVELKKKFGPYCLFVGRLVSYKGLEFLLEAMADAPLNLVVVGDGPLRSRLEDLAKSKTKNIYFVGQVPGREQLFAYYEGCEIFILPSISVAEQFGMVMMEAMAFKRPIISTKLESGVVDVNIEGVTGLQVPCKNSKALSESIRILMKDPDLRHQMGRNGYHRMHQIYNVENMHLDYYKIYQEVCGYA